MFVAYLWIFIISITQADFVKNEVDLAGIIMEYILSEILPNKSLAPGITVWQPWGPPS